VGDSAYQAIRECSVVVVLFGRAVPFEEATRTNAPNVLRSRGPSVTSHSHNTRTLKPILLSLASLRRSRARLVSNFSSQNDRFLFGTVARAHRG
jgi:hypothetical protein